MKQYYQFNSDISIVGRFGDNVTNDIIKNEPMFFNSNIWYAYTNGGPITRSFIDNLPKEYRNDLAVFDSRVHMLMPDWYPAIPGFHHDDVARGTDGQPNYDNIEFKSKHVLGLVNADICPTEFALGDCYMPKVDKGEIIYEQWHKEVKSLLDSNKLDLVKAKDRTIYEFDYQTFHQGNKAIANGWRWFGRVSINTERSYKITNEIRRQVQVYLENPMQGW